MPHYDLWILMGLGVFFVLLGVGAIVWGRSEEESFYKALSTHRDVREYLERLPFHPEPGALKAGGWIAIAVGMPMLMAAVAFLLWA